MTTKREELEQEIAVLEYLVDGTRPCPHPDAAHLRTWTKRLGGLSRDNVPSMATRQRALAEARAELAALESAQPKTATVEERFPVGSRWRSAEEGSDGKPWEIVGHDHDGLRWRYVGDADSGTPVTWDTWAEWEKDFTRLDDHPAPPPVAEPAPVPMVGDIVRNEQGDELVVTRVTGTGSEWPIGLQRVRDGAPMIGAKDAEQLYRTCTFVRRAQPQPAAPAKPAPMCEAPGWVGRAHAVDATEYGTCRVCGASAGDRRAARRRVFDADVYTEKGPCGWKRGNERVWRAAVSGIGEAFAPTREDAIEALWTRLEAER